MRLLVALVAVVVVAIVAVLIAVDNAPAPRLERVTSIDYSQSKAILDFDDSAHTITDTARIASFTHLVAKYSIDVWHFDQTLNDVCTGGLSTDIDLHFARAKTASLRLYDCGRTVPRGTFVSDATALFTKLRVAAG
jgi:hypothetical protein